MLTGIKLTTMASNPVILTHNHINPTFHRVNVTKIKKPESVSNPNFRSFSSSNHRKVSSRELRSTRNWLGILCRDGFLVKSTSGDGGSGGIGGSDSGGSGGSGGDGGGDKWSFIAWYLSLLEAYPVWTKAVTSALLTFIGDIICQVVIDQVPSLDLKRVFTFTFLGMALVGPTLHYWYLYLSKLVTMTGASGALLRLVIDQFIFAPAFIGVFLSTLVTLEGRPSQVFPKLQQEWLSSVIANWYLWIPFQFLNFRFVPQQFQVLAANFIALVWNVILSYKAHKVIAK